jgi:hypothetical protein
MIGSPKTGKDADCPSFGESTLLRSSIFISPSTFKGIETQKTFSCHGDHDRLDGRHVSGALSLPMIVVLTKFSS